MTCGSPPPPSIRSSHPTTTTIIPSPLSLSPTHILLPTKILFPAPHALFPNRTHVNVIVWPYCVVRTFPDGIGCGLVLTWLQPKPSSLDTMLCLTLLRVPAWLACSPHYPDHSRCYPLRFFSSFVNASFFTSSCHACYSPALLVFNVILKSASRPDITSYMKRIS